MRKLVKDLKVGDVLASGVEVTEAPFDSLYEFPGGPRMKACKCKIGIKYPNHEPIIKCWYKGTVVEVVSEFKYKIGQIIGQYMHDSYENATIIDRKIINGHRSYRTDLLSQWENEAFLRA